MQSAFVDIGLDSDAFLYVGDFLENLEDYDHVSSAVETKVEKMEQQGGAVFTPAAPQESAPPAESSAPRDNSQASELATFERPAPAASARPPAPAQFNRPHEQRDRGGDRGGGRGHGGFGRDRDRGRRRGGRFQRGGRGGRPQQGGRDLPPSKYASPRPFIPRPHETEAGEGSPANFEAVILPGESLAKYKDRGPSPHLPPEPPGEPVNAAAVEQLRGNTPETTSAPEAASLPSSLFAAPQTAPPAGAPTRETEPETSEWRWPTRRRGPLEPPVVPAAPVNEPAAESEADVAAEEVESDEEVQEFPHHEPAVANGADVTEDEMTALSERLAEARHEEATAEADADEVTNEPLLDDEEVGSVEEAAETEELAGDEHTEEERSDDEIREDAAALEAAGGF